MLSRASSDEYVDETYAAAAEIMAADQVEEKSSDVSAPQT